MGSEQDENKTREWPPQWRLSPNSNLERSSQAASAHSAADLGDAHLIVAYWPDSAGS
jgi:hypothetical protein